MVYKKRAPLALLAVLFLGASGPCRDLEAQGAYSFPSIDRLDPRDPVFKQYLSDVELARRVLFGQNQGREDPSEFLRIYAYTPEEGDDIFRLAARCNIPYAALATLNRIGHPGALKNPMLLPSVPGIFIPESPSNDLEQLLALSRSRGGGVIITVRGDSGPRRFLFFPGADFSPTERSYFLNPGFRFPLRSYRITSPFGMRPSPFTGRPQYHQGLDLAAPTGTEVYAAREGIVADLGTDPVYGNYIIIAHEDNWVSLYGHLSSFSTTLHSRVGKDTIIGKVGSTGQSTGPHLHFELRKNGTALDPSKLLFRN
ncbi:MAG: M23 family metallopeptidase [Spirochaetaceae bacterium]|jgi:murein DD-endopeptidase MepM/ murein hydrolase activator NlpD|nr:M23 family metallopeptidase [Spirochaetaceae bacterium]